MGSRFLVFQALFAASLIACGGEIELDPDTSPATGRGVVVPSPMPSNQPMPVAPKPVPPDTLRAMPTDIDDPIAQAICQDVATYEKSGTFTADPFFRLSDATSVTARLDEYGVGGSPDTLSGVTLVFHLPSQRGDDVFHGAYLGESSHEWSLSIGGKYPDVPTGTYDHMTIMQFEHHSLCYADSLGAAANDPWDGAQLENTKTVITSKTDSMIEGTITTADGRHRLDFRAPLSAAGFPKEGPICCFGNALAPNAPPKLAPACEKRPSGTFTADPSFGFEAGTSLEVYLDNGYGAEKNAAWLRLELLGPSTPGIDKYGDITSRHRTTIMTRLEAGYPRVTPGTYDAFVESNDRTESCYVNGIGFWTELPSKNGDGDGKVTINSQTDTLIAGVLELPGRNGGAARRLAFTTPVTPTPADVPTHPDCCRP